MFFLAWGLFWICYWSFSMIYGLAKGWDQQQLSFHLAMTMTTVIMIGIIYLKYILPDTIIVKYEAPEGAREALTMVPGSAMLNTPWSMALAISSSVSSAPSSAVRASATAMLPSATPRSRVVIVSSITDHLVA